MKKVFTVFALIGFATIVQAGNRFSQYPTVGGIAVNNLCSAGSEFRTIAPVPVCTEWKLAPRVVGQYTGNNWSCVSSIKKTVKVSKTYEVAHCEDSNPAVRGNIEFNFPTTCSRPTTLTKTHGSTFTVSVLENKGEAGLVVVGTFKHKVPACR